MTPTPTAPEIGAGRKHTPGPWSAGEYAEGMQFYVTSSDLTIVASASFGDDAPEHVVARANARLIAAAPDLLAAVKSLVRRCGPNAEDGAMALAAIEKAEGRS
jgi:hypothetical protein